MELEEKERKRIAGVLRKIIKNSKAHEKECQRLFKLFWEKTNNPSR